MSDDLDDILRGLDTPITEGELRAWGAMLALPRQPPPRDVRERFLNDVEFHAACVATIAQAQRDGGWLDPETVAKVLQAFDRSGAGALVVFRPPPV